MSNCAAPSPSCGGDDAVPFADPAEAWFWCVQAYQARIDGARLRAGVGLLPRPCEPVDVMRVVDRLYRTRRLLRDHLAVLGHYGRRVLPPDPDRHHEARAHTLWREALDRLGAVLRLKGIVA